MATILLIIYVVFICIGFSASLLGAVWPVMRLDLGAGLDMAGMIAMVTAACTIVSGLLSVRLVRRFGAPKVAMMGVLAMGFSLVGYGLSHSVLFLIVISLPLGLGMGIADITLNNYTALHYKPRHMNWLHSFWGAGAFAGPLIMGLFLKGQAGWRGGYLFFGAVQLVVAAVVAVSLPLWKRQHAINRRLEPPPQKTGAEGQAPRPLHRHPGLFLVLATFLLYCAVEHSVGLWGSSFLVEKRGFTATAAANAVAVYYIGITVGRFVSGFLTSLLSGRQLARIGGILMLAGTVMMWLPLSGGGALAALLVIGLGCAPVIPCMLHMTPGRFGLENSQKAISWQMTAAYCGSSFVPPVVGFVAGRAGMGLLPVCLLLLVVAMLASSELAALRLQRGAATAD